MDPLSNSSTLRADAVEVWDSNTNTYKEIQELIVGIPPSSMNTLELVAAAIGDDPNYFQTISEGLASKADLELTTSELAGKEPLVSLPANKVVTTTSSGRLEASGVSHTELGHLIGVTSSVQSQLDLREPAYIAISPLQKLLNIDTGDFELRLDDMADIVADAFQSGLFRMHATSGTSFEVQHLSGGNWETLAIYNWDDARRGGLDVNTIRAQSGSYVTVDENLVVEGDVATTGSFFGPYLNVTAVRTSKCNSIGPWWAHFKER